MTTELRDLDDGKKSTTVHGHTFEFRPITLDDLAKADIYVRSQRVQRLRSQPWFMPLSLDAQATFITAAEAAIPSIYVTILTDVDAESFLMKRCMSSNGSNPPAGVWRAAYRQMLRVSRLVEDAPDPTKETENRPTGGESASSSADDTG